MVRVVLVIIFVIVILCFVTITDFSSMFIDDETIKILYSDEEFVDSTESNDNDVSNPDPDTDISSGGTEDVVDNNKKEKFETELEIDPGFVETPVNNKNNKNKSTKSAVVDLDAELSKLRSQLQSGDASGKVGGATVDEVQTEFVDEICKEWIENGSTDQ